MKKTVKVWSIFFCILFIFSGCSGNKTVIEPTSETKAILGTTQNTQQYPQEEKNLVIKGENIATTSTLTGFAPLKNVNYQVSNTSSFSTEKKSHSHGPASNSQAHYTVVEFQKNFDKFNALTLDTLSEENVVYLTFDCGYEIDNLTNTILDTLKEKNVPATFFCTLHHIKSQPELITRMIKDGHIVGNHSATHPSFTEITRTQMAKEIEECENYLREKYGYCAYFFRFPAGEYSDDALDLVNSLGYKSIFWSLAYSDWDTSKSQGKEYAKKTVLERLHPGAVILLHSVSKDNAEALPEIIDEIRNKGYEFKSLEEYPFEL